MFSEILVSKGVFLDIKLLRYKNSLLLERTWWNEVCQNVQLKISETSCEKKTKKAKKNVQLSGKTAYIASL